MKYRNLIHSYIYTDIEKVEKTTEFVERMKKVQEEVGAVLKKNRTGKFYPQVENKYLRCLGSWSMIYVY